MIMCVWRAKAEYCAHECAVAATCDVNYGRSTKEVRAQLWYVPY